MSLFNNEDSDQQIVNINDYYRSHGLSDLVVTQLILHMLMTRTYALESDARECAMELNISLPFIFPDSGTLH